MTTNNGVIYKICCKDENITDCYVGSSCSIRSREYNHKRCCNNEKDSKYNFPVYRYIRDNGGWGNWSFIIIEKYPCEDKTELLIRERYWFEKLNAKLNSCYPYRSEEERKQKYYEENKQEIREKQKVYQQDNKVKIAQQKKEWYEVNKKKILEKQKEKVECECGSVVTKKCLQRHKRTQKHQENFQKKE
jgi:hypothetical protein